MSGILSTFNSSVDFSSAMELQNWFPALRRSRFVLRSISHSEWYFATYSLAAFPCVFEEARRIHCCNWFSINGQRQRKVSFEISVRNFGKAIPCISAAGFSLFHRFSAPCDGPPHTDLCLHTAISVTIMISSEIHKYPLGPPDVLKNRKVEWQVKTSHDLFLNSELISTCHP